jgi:hypothetical protein
MGIDQRKQDARKKRIDVDGWVGINPNTVQPVHLRIPGFEREYLARWKWLGLCTLFAWGIHILLLTAGTAWLTRGVTQREFEFGNQSASLAPFSRRAVATSLDFVVAAVVSLCIFQFLVLVAGIPRDPILRRGQKDPLDLAHDLFAVEQALSSLVHGGPITWQGTGSNRADKNPLHSSLAILPLFIALDLVASIARCFAKGVTASRPASGCSACAREERLSAPAVSRGHSFGI